MLYLLGAASAAPFLFGPLALPGAERRAVAPLSGSGGFAEKVWNLTVGLDQP
jgi:hypothetical protein